MDFVFLNDVDMMMDVRIEMLKKKKKKD